MKKLLLHLLFGGFSIASFAQELTLDYRNEGVLYVNPFGAGFIAGSNAYGDLGKYQRFDIQAPISVAAVTIFLGHKEIVGTADEISMVIKTQKDTAPDEELAIVPIMLDQFAEPGLGTRIDLPAPLIFQPGDSIFVGLEWFASGDDQFAILADKPGQGDLANRTWEQYGDGSFHSFNENSPFSWHLDTDLHIQLNYLASVGTQDLENSAAEKLEIQPNPAASSAAFSFDLQKPSSAILELIDLHGRVVSSLFEENLEAGAHSIRVETASLPEGIYAARLRADGAARVRLFSVLR